MLVLFSRSVSVSLVCRGACVSVGLVSVLVTATASLEDFYKEPTRHLESTSSAITEDSLNQPWAYYYGYDLPWTNFTSQIVIVSLQALVAFVICFFLPRYISIVPGSLVALVVLTLANITIKAETDWVAPTVGDYCTSEVSSCCATQDI